MSDNTKQGELFGDAPVADGGRPVRGEAGACRSCGAPVWWVQTTDKRLILNAQRVSVWLGGTWTKGWQSHFDTCPHAEQWRKR